MKAECAQRAFAVAAAIVGGRYYSLARARDALGATDVPTALVQQLIDESNLNADLARLMKSVEESPGRR